MKDRKTDRDRQTDEVKPCASQVFKKVLKSLKVHFITFNLFLRNDFKKFNTIKKYHV